MKGSGCEDGVPVMELVPLGERPLAWDFHTSANQCVCLGHQGDGFVLLRLSRVRKSWSAQTLSYENHALIVLVNCSLFKNINERGPCSLGWVHNWEGKVFFQ